VQFLGVDASDPHQPLREAYRVPIYSGWRAGQDGADAKDRAQHFSLLAYPFSGTLGLEVNLVALTVGDHRIDQIDLLDDLGSALVVAVPLRVGKLFVQRP
jgi:hypothetical protein